MTRRHRSIRSALAIAASVLFIDASLAPAQSLPTATFFKTLGGTPRGSNPTQAIVAGNVIYFQACTGVAGCEPWKSDGTAAGTVLLKDIVPGVDGSAPFAFTDVNGTVFFVVTNSSAALELWKTDGTTAGTVRVSPIASVNTNNLDLTTVNGTLFFVASDADAGEELWKSDGTAAGTARVKDINPGVSWSSPTSLTNVNGTLFFAAFDPVSGSELWKSDGTEAGTTRVRDTVPGSDSAAPAELVNVNGRLFFVQRDDTVGGELWTSDGTEHGTVCVKDIVAGTDSSAPGDLTAVGNTLFFTVAAPGGTRVLWKSDGTSAGTVQVADVALSAPMSVRPSLVAHAGLLFFTAPASDARVELWRSDGSAAGTQRLLRPFFMTSGLTSTDDAVFFTTIGEFHDLWKSDGTVAGTVQIERVRSDAYGNHPLTLTALHEWLFFTFAGNDREFGRELWRSDGSEAGTAIVADIDPLTDLTTQSYLPVNGTTFFVANDRTVNALWKTDGTASGTVKVKSVDVTGLPLSSLQIPPRPRPRLAAVGGTVFFGATEDGLDDELWKSDGTGPGTVRVKDIWPGAPAWLAGWGSGAPRDVTVLGAAVLFTADDGSGRELWRSDGTAAGTGRLTPVAETPDHYQGPTELLTVNGRLFFASKNGDLWKSDGTVPGTVRLADTTQAKALTDVAGTLFFMDGWTLWKSDGTEAGTVEVATIYATMPPPPPTFPPPPKPFPPLPYPPSDQLTAVNGSLFFRFAGRLLKSDAAGTVVVKDLGVSFDQLTNVNGTLFFVSTDTAAGRELWKSDGTTAGTVRVKDIAPGTADSSPDGLTAIGGRVLFAATDGVHGRELWVSDGTDSGTVMVRDIWLGSVGSAPADFGLSGDVVYFTANDPVRGRQLWKASIGTIAPTATDTDGDGLSNVWETNFGLSPTSAAGDDGPNGDPDGDGRSNLEEYLDGSHPRVSATLTGDRTTLAFGAVGSGTAFITQTPAQVVQITQQGTGTLTWSAFADQPWVQITPASGSGPAVLSIAVAPAAGLAVPGGTATIRLMLTGSDRAFHQVAVTLQLKAPGGSTAPIGLVDTPADNRTGVTGAIPFGGWALDDVEVARVMICRAAVPGEAAPIDPNCGGAAQIFVGLAVFIDGARPDVQAVAPTYPLNGRAGWGFMLLTNMLPGVPAGQPRGNGTYQFFTYAQDREGQTTLLGTRAMTCTNALATQPFGAIDTPAQGGTVSGTQFVNFGWALTQAGKVIPTDGSTISVWVDGTPVGRADYNHFRPDIAALFPGLANSDGAVGFRILDTTQLVNGLHAISWAVTDSSGATEGIGSRFFTVANTPGAGGSLTAGAAVEARAVAQTMRDPVAHVAAARREETPLVARRGWDPQAAWRGYVAGADGRSVMRGEEVDRFELWLGEPRGDRLSGYLQVGDTLAPLPAGSQLDAASGRFTWAPGPGFIGAYDLVFVRSAGARVLSRRDVRIILAPKGSGAVGVQVEIDTPRGQASVDQPFLFAGWAADLDAAAGSGIETLHVWAYPLAGGPPIFLGTPALGGARPDVASVHGERFGSAGFGLLVQGLAAGTYDLAAFPWSEVMQAFAPPKVVRVTVR